MYSWTTHPSPAAATCNAAIPPAADAKAVQSAALCSKFDQMCFCQAAALLPQSFALPSAQCRAVRRGRANTTAGGRERREDCKQIAEDEWLVRAVVPGVNLPHTGNDTVRCARIIHAPRSTPYSCSCSCVALECRNCKNPNNVRRWTRENRLELCRI